METLFNDSACDPKDFGTKRDALFVVIPITIIYVIIFITGTIGNITTCIVIARNKSLRSATNYYLFSLAVSDLVLLISGLPQEIYLIWNRYPYIFGTSFCFLRGFLSETSGNATVLTITGFTVERYLAICHPFLSHTMSKLSRAIKFILFIWAISIGFAVPQALPLKVVNVAGKCPLCLPAGTTMSYSFEIATIIFFVAPMTLITVLYVLIGNALRTSNLMKARNNEARAHSRNSRKVVKMLVLSYPSPCQRGGDYPFYLDREDGPVYVSKLLTLGAQFYMFAYKKIIEMDSGSFNLSFTVAVVATFFICWAPFHAQRLFYSYFAPKQDENKPFYMVVYAIVTYLSGILYYCSATTNPILYNIMSVKFREAFKETFVRFCGLGKPQPKRQYSVLSKNNVKCADSESNCTFQTNTTLMHKNSTESFTMSNGKTNKRFKFSTSSLNNGKLKNLPDINDSGLVLNISNSLNGCQLPPGQFYSTVVQNPSTSPNRLDKFKRFFLCIDDPNDSSNNISSYFKRGGHRNVVLELKLSRGGKKDSRCSKKSFQSSVCSGDISNSSLKDIENGALEEELSSYMNERETLDI